MNQPSCINLIVYGIANQVGKMCKQHPFFTILHNVSFVAFGLCCFVELEIVVYLKAVGQYFVIKLRCIKLPASVSNYLLSV